MADGNNSPDNFAIVFLKSLVKSVSKGIKLSKTSAKIKDAPLPQRKFRIPIALKLCIFCTLIIIGVIVTLSTIFLNHQKEELTAQTFKIGKITLNYITSISQEPLIYKNVRAIKPTIRKVGAVEGLKYAFIVDNNNIIMAHSDNSKEEQPFDYKELNPIAPEEMDGETTYFKYQAKSGDVILKLSQPIQYEDQKLGEAHVGVSIDFIDHMIDEEKQNIFRWSLLLIIISDFLAVLLITFRFSRPISKLVHATRELAKGNFQYKVKLTRTDELGELADSINSMGPKLEDHVKMSQTFQLAEQLQRNLLPGANPQIQGLDIAGESRFCDETGGDFYDFLIQPDRQGLTVIVGDVSGHGLESAFLMATARALLRQRSAMPGDIADIITDVNYQFNLDVGESGMFMTLFYAEIDEEAKSVDYVSAGHDPAIVYDIEKDAFHELAEAGGSVLGWFEDSVYKKATKEIRSGQILVICTDGLWEAHNAKDEMFGKERVKSIIRNHSDKSSEEIVKALIDELKQFCGSVSQEDDITLVIIRVM